MADISVEGHSHGYGNKLTPYETYLMSDCRIVYTGTGDYADAHKEDLMVYNIDLNVKENTAAHYTFDYYIVEDVKNPLLVVRRGQEFDITIELSRPYDITKDDLKIIFEIGKNPRPSKGTRGEAKPGVFRKGWEAAIKSNDGNRLRITVLTPADCPVAKWKLKIDVEKPNDSENTVYRYMHKDPVYILFNSWCKDDQVYIEDDSLKKEYVMKEDGEIYKGSSRHISRCRWNFGQFSGNVLECVMYLLDDVSKIKDYVRGDSVIVTREISSLVNSSDNLGVLTGKWASKIEDYSSGMVPWEWTGSVAILDEYYKKKRPVKYGQCWVFSGVVTTVCRALGIPARSVTNFASAHDTDGSISIDTHFDNLGEEIKELNDDSVWNFHVWNEVWMTRPDLPPGYDGWQAIDATPQERSRGVFCMGPTSVKAVKQGDVHLMYDGPFLFAEVNADRVHWCPDKLGNMRPVNINEYSVGKRISTKYPNYSFREDITDQYKFPDGSSEERDAVKKAHMKKSTREDVYKKMEWRAERDPVRLYCKGREGAWALTKTKDITFSLDINDETHVGETFKFSLKIKNNSDVEKTITGSTVLKSTDYTGKEASTLLRRRLRDKDAILKPQAEKLLTYEVSYDDYFMKLALDQCFIKATCLCKVDGTDQIFSDVQEMELVKPELTIQGPEKGVVNERFTVMATFKNPLPIPLTECKVTVDGHGFLLEGFLEAADTFPQQKDVPDKGTFTCTLELTPKKTGSRDLILAFNSKELHSIGGSLEMQIAASSDSREMEISL